MALSDTQAREIFDQLRTHSGQNEKIIEQLKQLNGKSSEHQRRIHGSSEYGTIGLLTRVDRIEQAEKKELRITTMRALWITAVATIGCMVAAFLGGRGL